MQKRGNGCLELLKKPKRVTVIEGFPGFGLVATIATGFLIDHLKCEKIGTYWFEEVPPTLAIHGCRAVDPVGIYYNQKNSIVVIHSITPTKGVEWKAAELVMDISKQLEAKEIITIEGVGSTEAEQTRGFYFTANPKIAKKLESIGIECLGEGIIVGVTGALLLKCPKLKIPVTSFFSETHSNLPDSKAAAKIIELLDKYLSLKIDYKPLLRQAEEFEKKLRSIIEQTVKAKEVKDKKQISYVG